MCCLTQNNYGLFAIAKIKYLLAFLAFKRLHFITVVKVRGQDLNEYWGWLLK